MPTSICWVECILMISGVAKYSHRYMPRHITVPYDRSGNRPSKVSLTVLPGRHKSCHIGKTPMALALTLTLAKTLASVIEMALAFHQRK